MKKFNIKFLFTILVLSLSLIASDISMAKGGKSFGGSRSFGGSKSFSSPKTSTPSSSFGGSKSTGMQRQSTPSSSFGGSKSTTTPSVSRPTGMTSSYGNNNYTSKYGAPRKTVTPSEVPGMRNNYRVHDYGGFSSGFMTGYAMASIPWYFHTPFHPAFYYSRPVEIANPDGSVDMYPPSFSFLKLFVGLAIFVVVVWIIIKIMRKVKGGGNSGSQSSFS